MPWLQEDLAISIEAHLASASRRYEGNGAGPSANRASPEPVRGLNARLSRERSPEDDGYFDLGRIVAAMRRQAVLVGSCALAGLVLAAIVVAFSVPRYRAVETVLLDEERADLLDQVSSLPGAVRNDAAVESEVVIIQSQLLALRVAETLRLHENEDFMNPPSDPIADAISWVKGLADPVMDLISPPEPTESGTTDPEQNEIDNSPLYRAASILRDGLEVSRVGRSFVIEIAYSGYAPGRVAEIARTYGEAYQAFQLHSTSSVAEGAGVWLQKRLDILEAQALEAAREVAEFRRQNGLVSVRGDLLSDQQLSEMTSQLIEAEADAAQKKARMDQFESLLAGGPKQAMATSTLLTETPSDKILATLREKYLESLERQRMILRRWDENHPEAQQLTADLNSIEEAIYDELTRAMAGIRASYEVAVSRVRSLRENLATQTGNYAEGSALLGQLRQLEETAETYREVYRDFLKRFEFASQRESFPVAAVQIISEAETPRAPNSPKKAMILAIGLFLGGLAGAAVGAAREVREQPLRTPGDMRRGIALPCAGLAPTPRHGDAEARVLERTLRAVKLAIDEAAPRSGGAVVGLAPVVSGENFDLAAPLAEVLAADGGRVLVIDAIHSDAGDRASGWPGSIEKQLDALSNSESVSVIRLADVPDAEGSPSGRVARKVPPLLTQAQPRFAYVVTVLPALSQSVAGDIFARYADSTVLAVPWGLVSPRLLEDALADNRQFASRLVTTVLTGADLREARRYMGRGSYDASLSLNS